MLILLAGWFHWLLTHKVSLLIADGAAGTLARYRLGNWIQEKEWAPGFPLGTFVVNVSGSFVLGIAFEIIRERLPASHHDWYLLIGTGFCGGYTTFSTFEYETYELIKSGSWGYAFLYVAGSVVVGFLAILLAIGLVHLIMPKQ